MKTLLFIKIMLKKLFYEVILIADDKPTIYEKIIYSLKVISAFTPVAFILKGLHSWFETNQQFFSFVVTFLIINIFVGWRYHKKMKTFSWEMFFKKNILMWSIILIVYPILEMLRITAGENFVGDAFRILIQISTLLYPGSKILKNGYILSNGKFPPKFIMERIYNFEQNGNLNDLFKKEENDADN